ncbi:MAG: FG-GAP repeat protein [Candidatus Zixiibacteriota bacterium]|nr:MAG: FG-GAP repeat protein [candidate division Zixibacteria bacterium]
MPKWLMRPLTVGMIVVVSVLYAFAASPLKRAGIRHISEDVPLDGSTTDLSRSPSEGPIDRCTEESKSRTSCADIDPEAGSIIQHDEIGQTEYEYQQNGSIGRMISIGPDGHRHFSWMSTIGVPPPLVRNVYSRCKNPSGGYSSTVGVDTAEYQAPGFVNQSHTRYDQSVVIYHRTRQVLPGDPAPFCMLSADNYPCIGDYTNYFDLPDSVLDAESGEKGMWPRLAVKYDQGAGEDYLHVVVTEGNVEGGARRMMAYQRCYWASWGQLQCQNYVNGSTQTYVIELNQNYSDPARLIAHFDSTCSTDPVVEVSPVSERVAMAFVKPACDGTCDYLGDVAYVESMVNGDDWVDGSNYPPADSNITNYGCGYPEDERARYDLNACYDYQDSLHIVWSTVGFPDLGYADPGVSKLYHWSKETGTKMITSAVWEGTNPGHYNANIAKMSISAVDPAFHPPDSNFLYCIWVQFDSSDTSAGGYGNGDIYGAGSRDGGASWGPCYNLTNTKTPDCAAGDCLSEHWASLSQNMRDGNLHIQYVCDRDAGAASVYEGVRTENPVMYLELEAWDPGPSDPDTGMRVYTGEDADDWFGCSVSGAGDVSNDGYDDLIIGAHRAGSGGKAYVLSGKNGASLWTFTAEGVSDWFGFSVSGAGDVDNDGYADVVIGAAYNNGGGANAGRAYVYSGQTGTGLWTFTGEAADDHLGISVSGAGDVNDDGYDDLIVGANLSDAGGTDAGRAYVYSGQTGGLLWTFTGEAAEDHFGRSVSGAGDVDNDGYSDLIVGAPMSDSGGADAGRAYVYSGQTGGLLWTFTGEAADDYFGWSVSGAGDVNNDGYDDLIAGGSGNDAVASSAGRAYVYSGHTGEVL